MTKTRLEAFSDGVIAILITIMVLEFKVPHGADLSALRPLAPTFVFYVLSYVNIGMYWSNHHHLFHATGRINGAVLWANLHLLFWLSLMPFTTAWMGENYDAPTPTAVYGCVLLMASIAYYVLVRVIVRFEGPHSRLAEALGHDVKGKVSTGIYIVAVALAFVHPRIAEALYATVALMWLVPDRRIEGRVRD
jgi:uncharacterized membrane protein